MQRRGSARGFYGPALDHADELAFHSPAPMREAGIEGV